MVTSFLWEVSFLNAIMFSSVEERIDEEEISEKVKWSFHDFEDKRQEEDSEEDLRMRRFFLDRRGTSSEDVYRWALLFVLKEEW